MTNKEAAEVLKIIHTDENGIATYPLYECSKCKLESMLNTWDYCPNCGCRMVESQESYE